MHPSRTTFCHGKCAPNAIFKHFLAKCLTFFEKAAGRSKSVVAGHTPISRGINSYIERVSHNNIGCREASKRFNVNSRNFFDPDFFTNFIPVGKPSQNYQKIWLDLQQDFV